MDDMMNMPPMPLWKHLELGISHFNAFNRHLKQCCPAEYHAINNYLGLMSELFISAHQKMESSAAAFHGGIASAVQPGSYANLPPPIGRGFGAIGHPAPQSASTVLSAHGLSHPEIRGPAPAFPPGIPLHTHTGYFNPGATPIANSIRLSRGGVESAHKYLRLNVNHDGFADDLHITKIMAQRAELALKCRMEEYYKEQSRKEQEALREQELKNRPPTTYYYAAKDGLTSTMTGLGRSRGQSSLRSGIRTYSPVDENHPAMRLLLSPLTPPTAMRTMPVDSSVPSETQSTAQFSSSKESSAHSSQYSEAQSPTEPVVTVQAPTPLPPAVEVSNLFLPIEPKDEAQAESKAVSMAERLAKLHQQEARAALDRIPVKSNLNSWAGIAVKGVNEEETKEINMRLQARPEQPPRTFTTIGRIKPKSVNVHAQVAQTQLFNSLHKKFEELQQRQFPALGVVRAERSEPTETLKLPDLPYVRPGSVASEKIQVPGSTRPEVAADQQRIAYILNAPRNTTVSQIADGIKEGPLVAIRPGTDAKTGQLFFCIIFQFAPCLNTFLQVMEDERMHSKPRRFKFIADCIRGPNLYPRDEVLRAMDEPIFARRRLTLAQKGLFFDWKKPDIEKFLDEKVGKHNVQFLHIYNGGNATICFTEVKAAIKIKGILLEMVRTKAWDDMFWELNVSYSKDPCETEIRLLSDGEF